MRNEERSVAFWNERLERGECSAVELTERCLSRIEKWESRVGAFLTVCREEALEAARASDRRRARGEVLSRLDGIPYAAKDSFCTKGIRTTAASRMLESYIPPYDATVISLLQESGAVLIGKTNLDEFAMGSATSHSALGATRNPLDPTRVAGGSSGGSAAAVAAGEVLFALGSDTGGSARQPAAFCGIMGLKPTYGAISRYGLIAFASSLDTVGLLAHNTADMALLLDVLAKKDVRDATCLGYTGRALPEALATGVAGLRIGILGNTARFSPAVQSSVKQAEVRLEQAGGSLREGALPSFEDALLSYCVISAVEASSNLARFDGLRYGSHAKGESPNALASATRGAYFGEEVKARILTGQCLLTGELRERYYLPACRVRDEIRRSAEKLFEDVDLILQPTAPCGAFSADKVLTPLQMREMDLCTVYASLAGIPALSVPMGADENGMPLGVQLMAAPMREDLILRAARILEQTE